MTDKIRVLVVDDHTILRRGLRESLAEYSDIAIEGEASNAQEALTLLRSGSWDVVLLDIALPDQSGLEILKPMKQEWPNLRVLALSFYPEEQYGIRMLKAGASGYLNKDSDPKDLAEAIRKVAAGGRYLKMSLAESIAHDLDPATVKPPHFALSQREFQVFCLLGGGFTIKQIAQKLFLSDKTISTYRQRVVEKMNMHSNLEIIRYVVENHLEFSAPSSSNTTPVKSA